MKKLIYTLILAAGLMTLSAVNSFAANSVIMGGDFSKSTSGPGTVITTETQTQSADGVLSDVPTFDANVPDSAQVLVTLSAAKKANNGMLKLYVKEENAAGKQQWTEKMSTKAMIGKNGLYKEKEGDNKTPVGVFKMNTPFGIGSALEGFPTNYVKVNKSHYWCGDNNSPMYNRFVSTDTYSSFDKSQSEHIIDYGKYYQYCIDTGYNPECTPFKGSAIYLHCVVGGQDTHGCIAIPENDMITVMRAYREGTTYIKISEQ